MLVIYYNTLTGVVLKTGVKMLDLSWGIESGADPGFQVDLTQKNHIFSNFRGEGRAPGARPPLDPPLRITNESVGITKTDRLKPPLMRQSRNMHSSSFVISPCKTQQRQESFSPCTISDWNLLSPPLVMSRSRSVETFKATVSEIHYYLLWNL